MLLHDIRYAVRTLLANKGFAIVAVLCLGLAIGINTMIYSVVDGILIQPLPFEDPGRLMLLNETNQRAGIRAAGVSYPSLRDWRSPRSAWICSTARCRPARCRTTFTGN